MSKKPFIKAISFFLSSITLSFLMPSSATASPTTAIEQQINIIDQEYSTTNTTAQPTDNSLGLIQWEADKYNDETVFFEAVIYCPGCNGGNKQATATLYTDGGTAVTGSPVSTTVQANYTRVRSGDITSNLTNNEEYSVRLSRDSTNGTAFIQSSRLIIIQDGTEVSDTLTHVELGNNTSTTQTSYSLMSGLPIYLWDADVHTDLSAIYFEATLQGSDSSAVSYATLSSSSDCSSTVTSSEISVTGISWGRSRTSDISSNLSDNTEYWVCTKTSTADTGYISNAKLIIEQSNTNGINIIETYQQYINTPMTDSDSGYTSQLLLNQFDPTNFSADIVDYFFESTLNSSSGTGYAVLYNNSDTSTITGSEVSYNSSSYSRQRSQDISSNLPSTAKTLDTQLKNQTSNTTTATSSWLVVRIDDVLDSDLSFSVAGTLAGQVFNQITTSASTDFDTLSFGNITVGEPRYISHQLDADTNAPGGYSVTVKLNTFMQGLYPGNNIDGFVAPWTAPTTWTEPTGQIPNQDTGWVGLNTSDTRVTNWSSAAQKFGVVNNSDHTVMSSSSEDSGTTAYVTYAIEVNHLQPADLYSGTLQYTILPSY